MLHDEVYRLLVPPGSDGLSVTLVPTVNPDFDLDLLGRYGLPVSLIRGGRANADRMMDLYGYLQDQSTNLARGAERDLAERNRYLMENRQRTARYVPEERFRRGAYVGEEASRRVGNILDTRRQDEREWRGHLAGQQELAGRRYGETSDRRIRGTLGAGQLAADATRSRIRGRERQGWWSRNIAPMSQSAGSAYGAYQAQF